MTETAYRPRVQWMQGTEARSVTVSELIAEDELQMWGDMIANAIYTNGALTVEAKSGNCYTIPGRLITEVCYQRVEVDPAHRPDTTPAPSHDCCADHWSSCTKNPLLDPNATDAAQHTDPDAQPDDRIKPYSDPDVDGHNCDTTHVTADEYGACLQRRVELAEQEARHPGLGALLEAVAVQLPPDDPDRCAETLATMNAGGTLPFDQPDTARYAFQCKCWPGSCMCNHASLIAGGGSDGA